MKKLMVYLDDDFHGDLKTLAFRKKTTMAALIRYAVDKTFEDEFDAIAGERALEEAAGNPSSTMSWEEHKASRSGAVRVAFV